MWVSVGRWWALAYFVGLVSRISRQFTSPLTSESDTFCHMPAPQNRAEAAWNRRSPLNSGQRVPLACLVHSLLKGKLLTDASSEANSTAAALTGRLHVSGADGDRAH